MITTRHENPIAAKYMRDAKFSKAWNEFLMMTEIGPPAHNDQRKALESKPSNSIIEHDNKQLDLFATQDDAEKKTRNTNEKDKIYNFDVKMRGGELSVIAKDVYVEMKEKKTRKKHMFHIELQLQ